MGPGADATDVRGDSRQRPVGGRLVGEGSGAGHRGRLRPRPGHPGGDHRPAGFGYFDHPAWDANAWAELNIALKEAGFRLVNVYVVFSENPVSVHINNLNAIKHDAILVLALDGELPPGRWSRPEPITTSESQEFCRQCGQALGWLLDQVDSPAEIRTMWGQLMSGRSNDLEGFGGGHVEAVYGRPVFPYI